MKNPFFSGMHALHAGQLISGSSTQPHILHVMSGRVWITVEGLTSDYWLAAGDQLTMLPDRLIVIEADRMPCTLRFERVADASVASGRTRLASFGITRKAHRSAPIATRRIHIPEA